MNTVVYVFKVRLRLQGVYSDKDDKARGGDGGWYCTAGSLLEEPGVNYNYSSQILDY
jgi:hypothetical protein